MADQTPNPVRVIGSVNIPPPTPVNINGDALENWRFFKAQWTNYCIASELDQKSPAIQVATLLSMIGKECFQIFQNLPLPAEQQRSVQSVLDALDSYFIPKVNVIYERYVFHSSSQEEGEMIDAFVNRLRKLATTCAYGDMNDDMIRDKVVLGIRDVRTRRRLLTESNLTLDRALELCRSDEVTNQQLKQLDHTSSADINFNKKVTPRDTKQDTSVYQNPGQPCKYCGRRHEARNCPAFGKTCNQCNKKNHFAAVCQSIDRPNNGKPMTSEHNRARKTTQHKVHAIEEDPSDESDASVFRVSIQSKEKKENHTLVQINVGLAANREYHKIKAQIDTGADCNVMGFEQYRRLAENEEIPLAQSSVKLRAYSGNILLPVGQIQLACKYKKRRCQTIFQVIKGEHTTLLSADTSKELGLVKILANLQTLNKKSDEFDTLINEFKDVFDGLGKLPHTCQLKIEDDAIPVQHKPRRIPLTIRRELRDYLTKLEKKGIIAKVTEPTPWIHNTVVARKGDKIRLCLDPSDLNKVLKRPKYPMSRLEEILPELSKAKVFSVVDVKNAFWHVELDEASSKLTTFWTSQGRFCWKRLPFGIATASEEFQCRLHESLTGLPGIEIMADDILIYGSGEDVDEATKNHDTNLRALLIRCRSINLKLNKQKFKYKLNCVPYMGHVLTSDGLKPDPAKLKAIENAPRPKNAKEVQTFLGFVTYLAKFIPKLTELGEPLRKAIHRPEWRWCDEEEQAWQNIKSSMLATPTLKYYDSTKPIVLQCDASSIGVGAAMMQEGKPIAYASRKLTNTEQRYAQIEKEMLAIVVACERFSQYLIGHCDVTVETDHKPLETIMKKPLLAAPIRLQRMMLRLQRYRLHIKYKRGVEMHLADYLSRAPIHQHNDPSRDVDNIYRLQREDSILREIEGIDSRPYVHIRDERLERIKQETCNDNVLQTLKEAILTGWPADKEDILPTIRPFWNFRDEMTTQDGLIYKGGKVVIPLTMKNEILKIVHSSHMGREACLRRAREVVFWPGLNTDVANVVDNCTYCQEVAASQQKETLISYPVPDLPWSIVSTDIFHANGKDYLVTVDNYSSYWEIDELPDMSSYSVITKLKEHFSTHGIPCTVVSDNGPQYASTEFHSFANKWKFCHVTSSPYHSQSNGHAEAAVKAAKKLVKKVYREGSDLRLAILEHRNVPRQDMKHSPVQMLMSRRTRTLLPATSEMLKPCIAQDVKHNLERRRSKDKLYYDKTAKDLEELQPGQVVRAQMPSKKWLLGTVRARVAPRSYQVDIDGSSYRKNRKFLRPTSEITPIVTEPEMFGSTNTVPPAERRSIPVAEAETGTSTDADMDKTQSQSTPQNVASPMKTRSGRIVRPPTKMQDYVVSK